MKIGCHHQLNGHEFDKTQGDSEGQRSLLCCSPQGRKVLDMTEQQQVMKKNSQKINLDFCLPKENWKFYSFVCPCSSQTDDFIVLKEQSFGYSFLLHCYQTQVKELKVKNKIIKLLEDNIGKFFYNLQDEKGFFSQKS